MRRYLLLGLLFASVTAHAATSLRVNDKVLTIGDSAAYVQQLMGPPTMRSYVHLDGNSAATRTHLRWANRNLPDDQLAYAEQWQYVQGNKIEIITIVGGRVTNFETEYH
jgi:hypothetical protein